MKNLSGIKSILRDLKDIDQYTGRIFELEVLAEFARSGFNPELTVTPDCKIVVESSCFLVEIVHRSQRFARLLGDRIWRFLGSHTLKLYSAFYGAITVTLQPGAGGAAEDPCELANKIGKHVVEAAPYGSAINVFYLQCRVRYDPKATEASLAVRFGGNESSYPCIVDQIAYRVLKSKIRQLTQRFNGTERTLIAANFGPLLQQIPDYLRTFPESSTVKRHDQDKQTIIAATAKFLKDYPIVSGVLIWWERPFNPDARTMVFGPRPISLVTSSDAIELSDDGLAGLLRAGKLL